MDPKDSKNVTFIEIYLRPSLSTNSSGLPDFYSVKLDVIGFGQIAHFWNREGPYNAAMHLVSFGVGVPYPKFIESWCEKALHRLDESWSKNCAFLPASGEANTMLSLHIQRTWRDFYLRQF